MELFAHQKALLARKPRKWLLAWGTGTGKTLAALELANKMGYCTLVVCPKGLVKTWQLETMKIGMKGVVIVSKENFKKLWKELPFFNTLILDEAHHFYGMTGKKWDRSKRERFLAGSALFVNALNYIKEKKPDNIYQLTATPYRASPFNLYAMATLFGEEPKYDMFKERFFDTYRLGARCTVCGKSKCNCRGDRRTRVTKPKTNIEEPMAQFVAKFGNAVKLDDCFDIPEQIFQVEFFSLNKAQKEAINDIIESHPSAVNTQINQIENGLIRGDEYQEPVYLECDKTNRIIELCQEHKKIAVVCHYLNQIRMIKKKLEKIGKKVFVLDGANKDRAITVEQAEASEECVILIQSACSEGYGLPSFPVMVFASMDFSLVNYVQMLGRIQRAGRIKKNIYIFLLAERGIDMAVYDNIVNKKQPFNDAIYEYAGAKRKTRGRGEVYHETTEVDSSQLDTFWSVGD